MAFIENLKTFAALKKRNRPSKATDCVFCKTEINDSGVIKNIKCRHPNGKILADLDNKMNCVSGCEIGFEDMGSLKIDYALFANKFDRYLLNETILLLSMLIPSVIALCKIVGDI